MKKSLYILFLSIFSTTLVAVPVCTAKDACHEMMATTQVELPPCHKKTAPVKLNTSTCQCDHEIQKSAAALDFSTAALAPKIGTSTALAADRFLKIKWVSFVDRASEPIYLRTQRFLI